MKLRENESMDSALKRFRKQVEDEGIMKELKKRQYFVKKSLVRHQAKRDAIRRIERG